MMTLENLTMELRKRAVRCQIPAATRDALKSLDTGNLPLESGAALVRFLEETPLYSPARDRVLAELLRTMKPGPGRPFADLLMFAFLPSICRLHRRVVSTAFTVDEEILADVLADVLDAIAAYDPTRKSPHVQANIEMNVLNAFHRRWALQRHTRQAESAVSELVKCAEDSGRVLAHSSWFFPGGRLPAESMLTLEEIQSAERALAALANKGLLSRLDAELVGALCVQGLSSTLLGHKYSMDRRTVVRRVRRATSRILTEFANILQTEMPVSACL